MNAAARAPRDHDDRPARAPARTSAPPLAVVPPPEPAPPAVSDPGGPYRLHAFTVQADAFVMGASLLRAKWGARQVPVEEPEGGHWMDFLYISVEVFPGQVIVEVWRGSDRVAQAWVEDITAGRRAIAVRLEPEAADIANRVIRALRGIDKLGGGPGM